MYAYIPTCLLMFVSELVYVSIHDDTGGGKESMRMTRSRVMRMMMRTVA